MEYEDLIKSIEFDRKVEKLSKMWAEHREEEIAQLEASWDTPYVGP